MLFGTYKKVELHYTQADQSEHINKFDEGKVELHYTQEDQSEHINKFDEGDPPHEDILCPDLTSIAHSC